MTAPAKTKGIAQGSLAQVAARSQVSIGTVSRIFNNSPQIPQETRARVMRVARELGIRPRVGVRGKQIAIITEPPWKTTMGGYVNTLTQYLCFALSREQAGITLVTENALDVLNDSWFDGIIGIAWEDATVACLKSLGVPVVWFSNLFPESFHAVYLDPVETGAMAGAYLAQKGHRRIAVIHDADYSGNGRADGVEQALREQTRDPEATVLRIPNTKPMHLSIKQVLDAGCTAALVTGEDLRVLEANWLLQELAGRKVPEDISLMGFENPGISEYQRPALTTIASPLREMADGAVDILMHRDPAKRHIVKLLPRIIERNSVRSLG